MDSFEFDDYLNEQSRLGSWGGYLELGALCVVTKRPVLVLRKSSNVAHQFASHFSKEVISLMYHDHHYMSESIVR